MDVGAYLPCFNNSDTIVDAAESVRSQSVPPSHLIIIDDGSTDASVSRARAAGFTVYENFQNRGRGYVRNTALNLLSNEWILCCDATNTLPQGWVEQAKQWMSDLSVAEIHGQIMGAPGLPQNLSSRWRSRHLFQEHREKAPCLDSTLITYGSILRRSAACSVGGFNPHLRQGEDRDLGDRLIRAGYKVVFDPTLPVYSNVNNSLVQLLERFWRWYSSDEGDRRNAWQRLPPDLKNCLALMIHQDLRERDFAAAFVSAAVPFYNFFKNTCRSFTENRARNQANKCT